MSRIKVKTPNVSCNQFWSPFAGSVFCTAQLLLLLETVINAGLHNLGLFSFVVFNLYLPSVKQIVLKINLRYPQIRDTATFADNNQLKMPPKKALPKRILPNQEFIPRSCLRKNIPAKTGNAVPQEVQDAQNRPPATRTTPISRNTLLPWLARTWLWSGQDKWCPSLMWNQCRNQHISSFPILSA